MPMPRATDQARVLANRAINTVLADPLTLDERLSLFRQCRERRGDDLAGALIEVLTGERTKSLRDDSTFEAEFNAGRVLVAAWLLLLCCETRLDAISTEIREAAEKRLSVALHTDEAPVVCGLLVYGGTSTGLVKPLRDIASREGSESTLAVIALSRAHSERADMIPRLRRVVRQSDEFLAGMAGIALIQASLSESVIPEIIIPRVAVFGDSAMASFLCCLRHMVRSADAFFPMLKSIILGVQRDSTVRCAAAAAMGRVCSNPSVLSVLEKAAQCSDYLVVDGAISGFKEAASFPPGIEAVFLHHLSDPGEDLRGTAAIGLAALGEPVGTIAGELSSLLKTERSLRVRNEIVNAIAAVGERAIPYLVEHLRQFDSQTCELVADALRKMGEPAAAAMGREAVETKDPALRRLLLFMLAAMGSAATPAVDVLGEFLQIPDDEFAALTVTWSLGTWGYAAAPIIPYLILCLRDGALTDRLGDAIERVLHGLGQVAIDELKRSIIAEPSERLQSVLARLDSGGNRRFTELEAMQIDQELIQFTWMVEILRDYRPEPVSCRNVAKLLKDRGMGKKHHVFGNIPIIESALRRAQTTLYKALGFRVISADTGSRGTLIKEADRAYAEIKDYIAWREQKLKRLRNG